MCGCLLCAPYWGPGLQPRHVLWLGIEPATLWLTVPCSVHWATPARDILLFCFLFSNGTSFQDRDRYLALYKLCMTHKMPLKLFYHISPWKKYTKWLWFPKNSMQQEKQGKYKRYHKEIIKSITKTIINHSPLNKNHNRGSDMVTEPIKCGCWVIWV